jgi:hypothetical protein
MSNTIDPTKTYRTRDGREVRIYAVDGKPGTPNQVHGAILDEGEWFVKAWFADGMYSVSPGALDLIEVKPKHVRWVNVYADDAAAYRSRTGADIAGGGSNRIACIRIEFEEGEGL